ncbi:MAG TPA: PEP-CTERM sorting domain-containing protein [Dongiaceae bacterium]|nr:PEP-CTERM sorting domain-containing protein [Dongiaceae bacterium]
MLIVVSVTLTFVFVTVSLRYLTPSLFDASRHVEPSRESSEASRNAFLQVQQEALRDLENRKVYPYSVVPGGVRNARELKWAAEHDPVVAAHYAGFDYDHARVVRLVLARTAYVSYRIGNRVYWTRRRLTLKKGETVITDGKITARTRCANRVEEMPQQATSESEPPPSKFDEPAQPAVGTALKAPPVPFQTALLNRNPVPGLGPAPPLTSYDPISNEAWTPISPPPLPSVCGVPPVKKKPADGTATASTNKKKKKSDPCESGGGGPGGEVPEPGTWLMIASGGSALLMKVRQKFAARRSAEARSLNHRSSSYWLSTKPFWFS